MKQHMKGSSDLKNKAEAKKNEKAKTAGQKLRDVK